MEAAHASAPKDQATAPLASERRCLVTGETLSRDDLVRFVVGPDNTVVPDLAQNLPGRGLWVKADRDAITAAARKGLFARAAKTAAKAAPDLADLVARLLRARCLDFIGLARGAGLAILGQPQVEAALKSGKLAILLLADDASSALDNRRAVEEYRSFTRDELGAALGHDRIVYAGLKAHGLTERLKIELCRLGKMAKPLPKTDGALNPVFENKERPIRASADIRHEEMDHKGS
jgi:predicted RNA-binding protein YlxR (DUF448 family)